MLLRKQKPMQRLKTSMTPGLAPKIGLSSLANREFVDETTEDENTAVSTSRTIKDFILCVQKHTAQLLPAACGAAVNLFAEYLIPVVAYGQPVSTASILFPHDMTVIFLQRISTFKLLLRKVMSFPFVVIGSLLAASWGLIRHCCAVIVRMMRHAATKAVADAMVENVDDTLARAEDMAVVLANAETIKNVEFMLPTSEYENTIVSTSRKIGVSSAAFPVGLRTPALLSPSL